jgi:threonine dehydratase
MDTVIVPVGGGGLIAGISLALKSVLPAVEIIGVQAGHVPAVVRSLEEGERTCVPSRSTLADGIAVAAPGELPFAIIQRLVDKVGAVAEESIESAVMTFLERKNLVVEGAGATPLALLQEGETRPKGQNVVLVVSGGNLDIQWMDRIIQRGALALARRMQLSVLVRDIPGSLSQITTLIAESGANIVQVYHRRWAPEYPVNVSRVDFDLEIQDHAHAQSLLDRLRQEGVEIVE